jgi:hypothetical protein
MSQESNRLSELVKETYRVATTHQGRGQIPAIQMIWDRLDGKVVDKHLNMNVSVTPEEYQGMLEAVRRANETDEEFIGEYYKGEK